MNTPIAFNGALMLGAQSIVGSNLHGPFQIAEEDRPFDAPCLGRTFESYERIYGLVHPTTGVLRYIGGTAIPLETRVRRHIRFAERGDSQRPVCEWINELAQQGLTPSPVTLMTINTAANVPNYTRDIERSLIREYEQNGYDLLNVIR